MVKTLRDVRRSTTKISNKTRKMKPNEVVGYFQAASRYTKEASSGSHLRKRA
jgi:hypothetical protein